MPRSPLTVEKLSKDINFFEGYVAKCVIELASVANTLVDDFISKYQQDDVIVEPLSNIQNSITFNIYSNGEKQLRSLINMIGEDLNVVDFELIYLGEC